MRFPLAAFACALAACGPARPDPAVLRYAVVSTLAEDSPLSRELDRLVAYRRAELFRVPTFAPHRMPALLDWLRDRDFAYVAFVAPPEALDAGALGTLARLAAEVDSDPYADFAFGFFPAFDLPLLRRQVDALIAAEGKIEKRLLRATRLACAAPASSERTDRLEWATGLPLRRLEAREGDASFLEKALPDVERCDHLVVAGETAQGGVRGLPFPYVRRLRLDSSAVFCAAGWTGDPGRPFLAELVRAGATSVFAPPADAAPARAEFEWAEAVFSDLPAGEVAKRCADTALLAGDADLRLLFGDPLLDSWTRPVRGPLQETHRRADPEGRWLDVGYKIVAWDAPAWFADPRGGERLHLRIPVPAGTKRAPVISAKAGDAAVDARAGAVERWRGATLAHVLLRAPKLAREDLFLSVRIGLE